MIRYAYFIIPIALIALLFGQKATLYKLQLTANIGSFFGSFIPNSDLKARISDLEMQNADLKTQILNNTVSVPKTFKVYSSYPFNNASEIAVAAGKNQGFKEGDVITFGKTLLVGRIKKVFDDYSIITTLHDPGWEMAVRIGETETDGLLMGGIKLVIDLIPPKSQINIGDIVVTASAGFPYGLSIGSIKEIIEDPATHFKSAVIEPAIQLQDLRNVSIYAQ